MAAALPRSTAHRPTPATAHDPAGPANVPATPMAAIASPVPTLRQPARAAMTAAQARPGTISTVVGYQAKLTPAAASAHMITGTAAHASTKTVISAGRIRVLPRTPAIARSRTATVAPKLRTMNATRMGMSAGVGPW